MLALHLPTLCSALLLTGPDQPTAMVGAPPQPHAMAPLSVENDSLLVAGVIASFHKALADGDSTGAMGWLAPDVVVLESGGRETRQEYRDHHLGADMAYARSTPSTRGPISVSVVGDVAWAHSTSESTRTVEGRTIRSSGAELMVLSRTPEGWRIRAIHWSSRSRRVAPS